MVRNTDHEPYGWAHLDDFGVSLIMPTNLLRVIKFRSVPRSRYSSQLVAEAGHTAGSSATVVKLMEDVQQRHLREPVAGTSAGW